jgi:hypothetical protein
MDHGTEAVFLKQRADERLIAHITDDQFDSRIDDRRLVAEDQIVEHDDFPALRGQQAHRV